MKTFKEFMNESGDMEPKGAYAKVYTAAQKEDFEPKVLSAIKKILVDASEGEDEESAYKKQRGKIGTSNGKVKSFLKDHGFNL